jgi:hypothetical protein
MCLSCLLPIKNMFKTQFQPFKKVHRNTDLSESVIKTYSAVLMSEYLLRAEGSEAVNGLFTDGLRTVPLDTFQYFSRKLIRGLDDTGYRFFPAGFEDSFEGLDNALYRPDTYLIYFGNVYAKSDTPSYGICLWDVSRYAPFLKRHVSEGWIAGSMHSIREGMVFLQHEDSAHRLHAMLVVSYEAERPSSSLSTDRREEGLGLLKTLWPVN